MSLLNLKVYIIIKYLGKLVEWKAAIKAFNDKNMEEALDRFCVRNKTHFKAIADQAKMHYNISICCCNLFDYEKANVALGKAIEADPYFALAFYQRGWINTQLGRHSNALKDYISAYKAMRKNLHIDYTQIGLDYKLQTQDIVLNAGLVTVLLGNIDQAKIHFKKGYQISDENQRKLFKKALFLGNEAASKIPMKFAPLSLVFIPHSEPTDQTDFLGVSKVVSGTAVPETSPISSEDQSSDFLFDYMSEQSERDSSSGLLSRKGTKNISPRSQLNKLQINNSTGQVSVSDLASPQRSTMYSTGSTISTVSAMGVMRIQLQYNNRTHFVRVPNEVTFRDLLLHIQNKLDLDISFTVSFQNEQGENIILTDDEDFRLILSMFRNSKGEGDIKFNIID